MREHKNKKKKPLNKYLLLTSLSFQMGITIYLGAYIGEYFDKKNEINNNLYTNICVLFSVAISLYMFIKQANKLNNEK